MFRAQFDELQRDVSKKQRAGQKFAFATPEIHGQNVPKLRFQQKDIREGELAGISGSEIDIICDQTQKRLGGHYKHFALLDANGDVVSFPLADMTGRPIEVGTWIAFSEHAGNSSHDLRIGRITKISDVGALTLEVVGRRTTQVRTATDRAIVLPFDQFDFVMYRMGDFKKLDY